MIGLAIILLLSIPSSELSIAEESFESLKVDPKSLRLFSLNHAIASRTIVSNCAGDFPVCFLE